MADVCCPPIVGGRIYISWESRAGGGVKRLEASGAMKIRSMGERRDAKVTNSGRLVGTVEAMPQVWEVDLWAICGASPIEMWNERCHINTTVVEVDTGRRHMFSDGMVFGEPELDPSTGVWTGIKMGTDSYSYSEENSG